MCGVFLAVLVELPVIFVFGTLTVWDKSLRSADKLLESSVKLKVRSEITVNYSSWIVFFVPAPVVF